MLECQAELLRTYVLKKSGTIQHMILLLCTNFHSKCPHHVVSQIKDQINSISVFKTATNIHFIIKKIIKIYYLSHMQ